MDKGNISSQSSLLTSKVLEHQSFKRQLKRIRTIGNGAYGNVELVSANGMEYALKRMDKKKLEKLGEQHYAYIEKQLLNNMNHPGVIKLISCFQDSCNLYFCLEYCEGGDFMKFIEKYSFFMSDDLKVFYIAQIVSILTYLQKINLTHRDIKPQNILLTKSGHLKLTDFATAEIKNCKILSKQFKEKVAIKKLKNDLLENQVDFNSEKKIRQFESSQKSEQFTEAPTKDFLSIIETFSPKQRKGTFVGTSYYISPQMLEKDQCSHSSDLWALGCIMYQLYYHQLPFDGNCEYQIFQKIIKGDFKIPQKSNVPSQAIDLIRKLIRKNPSDRIGSGCKEGLTMEDLMAHPYFSKIQDFQQIFDSKVPSLMPQKSQHLSGAALLSYHIKNITDDPNILIHGYIEKKTFLLYNYYYLAIFKDLKIVRIKKQEPKKYVTLSIALESDEFPASFIDQNSFSLTTSNKTYKLKSQCPQKWIETINDRFVQMRIKRGLNKALNLVENQSQQTCPEGLSLTP